MYQCFSVSMFQCFSVSSPNPEFRSVCCRLLRRLGDVLMGIRDPNRRRQNHYYDCRKRGLTHIVYGEEKEDEDSAVSVASASSIAGLERMKSKEIAPLAETTSDDIKNFCATQVCLLALAPTSAGCQNFVTGRSQLAHMNGWCVVFL